MCCESSTDPKVDAMAQEQAQIGRDALTYYQQQQAANAPLQDALNTTSSQATANQLGTADFASGVAKDQYANYLANGQPVQNQMFSDAMNYDSADRQAEAAGEAGTDVQKNLTAAKDSTARNMASMGVNPNSARFAATNASLATTGALAEAGAETAARKNVRDTAIGVRQTAAQIAGTMPATATAAAGLASSASGAAVQSATAPVTAANSTTSTTGAGYQIASQGVGGAGNLLMQQQNAKIQAQAARDAAIVSAAGSAASTYGTRTSYKSPTTTG